MPNPRVVALSAEITRLRQVSQARAAEEFNPVPPEHEAPEPTTWPPPWRAVALEDWLDLHYLPDHPE